MPYAFYWLVDTALNLYMWAIIMGAILSWLVAFKVINAYNQFVQTVLVFLRRVTEPALRPIRRFMPDLGGVDISPIILILLIQFLRILWRDIYPFG